MRNDATSAETPEFLAVACIHFADQGPDEMGVLGRGSKEECARITDLTDTVSYSGSRPVKSAEALVLRASEYPELRVHQAKERFDA